MDVNYKERDGTFQKEMQLKTPSSKKKNTYTKSFHKKDKMRQKQQCRKKINKQP